MAQTRTNASPALLTDFLHDPAANPTGILERMVATGVLRFVLLDEELEDVAKAGAAVVEMGLLPETVKKVHLRPAAKDCPTAPPTTCGTVGRQCGLATFSYAAPPAIARPPLMVVQQEKGQWNVYCSWDGATYEHSSWELRGRDWVQGPSARDARWNGTAVVALVSADGAHLAEAEARLQRDLEAVCDDPAGAQLLLQYTRDLQAASAKFLLNERDDQAFYAELAKRRFRALERRTRALVTGWAAAKAQAVLTVVRAHSAALDGEVGGPGRALAMALDTLALFVEGMQAKARYNL